MTARPPSSVRHTTRTEGPHGPVFGECVHPIAGIDGDHVLVPVRCGATEWRTARMSSALLRDPRRGVQGVCVGADGGERKVLFAAVPDARPEAPVLEPTGERVVHHRCESDGRGGWVIVDCFHDVLGTRRGKVAVRRCCGRSEDTRHTLVDGPKLGARGGAEGRVIEPLAHDTRAFFYREGSPHIPRTPKPSSAWKDAAREQAEWAERERARARAEAARRAQEARERAERIVASVFGGPSLSDAEKTLGVRRPFSADELRRAYRIRARQAHPDAGGTDAAFIAVRRAYELLQPHAREAVPA